MIQSSPSRVARVRVAPRSEGFQQGFDDVGVSEPGQEIGPHEALHGYGAPEPEGSPAQFLEEEDRRDGIGFHAAQFLLVPQAEESELAELLPQIAGEFPRLIDGFRPGGHQPVHGLGDGFLEELLLLGECEVHENLLGFPEKSSDSRPWIHGPAGTRHD
jgi:hypothetical protein